MQRRAIQLSVVFVAVFAVAMPSRAEQADATMGVGLRIVASVFSCGGEEIARPRAVGPKVFADRLSRRRNAVHGT